MSKEGKRKIKNKPNTSYIHRFFKGIRIGAFIALLFSSGLVLGRVTSKSEVDVVASNLTEENKKKYDYPILASGIMTNELKEKFGDYIDKAKVKIIKASDRSALKYDALEITIYFIDGKTVVIDASTNYDGEVIQVDENGNQIFEYVDGTDLINTNLYWKTIQDNYSRLKDILRGSPEYIDGQDINEDQAEYWKNIADVELKKYFKEAVIKGGREEVEDQFSELV